MMEEGPIFFPDVLSGFSWVGCFMGGRLPDYFCRLHLFSYVPTCLYNF